MEITAIEVTRHVLPLDPPFQAAWDPTPRAQFAATMVRVQTDTGHEGVGSGDDMVGFETYRSLFVGEHPLSLRRHAAILDNIAFHAGRCWPLDLALWDLAGKILGQPVWRLLGGNEPNVPLYASTGALREPDAFADFAEELADSGFAAMKIRVRPKAWREDIKILRRVRARIGRRLEIMVDCNQAWRMPWDDTQPIRVGELMPMVRAFEELGVFWLEEPLGRGDLQGLAELRGKSDIAIAGGEMARELSELERAVAARSYDIIQPDAALTGGITGLRDLAAVARSQGIRFTPHTWTNGLGVLANAHLFAGVGGAPFLEFPYDSAGWTPERRDFFLERPIEAERGALTLSERPGFGVTLDEAQLAATRVS